jgi:hypothetical protein
MSNAQQRLRVLRAVAQQADRDEVRGKAEELGRLAAEGLTRNRRAQVTGLENAANSAMKTSDVLDYIKLRAARHKEWMHGNWGPDLLDYLSGSDPQAAPLSNLRLIRNKICTDLNIKPDSAEGLDVYVLLIREFLRQFSAEYEYKCELQEAANKSR